MRLAKMTTRRWIVAVAVVALVLGIVAFVRRRAQFRRLRITTLRRPGASALPTSG